MLTLIFTNYVTTNWRHVHTHYTVYYIGEEGTVRPLLSAVLGRTKFWSQKPRIIEVQIIDV